MRLHTAGVISSAGRAPPLQGGGRRFDPVITHHFCGSLAQLVEQLTFNQLVAGSNPARPTISDKTLSAERRFFVFVLPINSCGMRTCRRFESNEVRQRCVSNGPKGEAKPSNPARPTISDKTISAERRFFVFVLRINSCGMRTCRRFESNEETYPLPIFPKFSVS